MRRVKDTCDVCGRHVAKGTGVKDCNSLYCSPRCASYGFQRYFLLRQYADELDVQSEPLTGSAWDGKQNNRFGSRWNEKLDEHKTDAELADELSAFLHKVYHGPITVLRDTSYNDHKTFLVDELNVAIEIYSTAEGAIGSDWKLMMQRISYFARNDCFLVQIFEPQWILERGIAENQILEVLGL